MVRDFQSVIGREARAQILERIGRLPKTVIACVGGGSNAMGIFHAFVDDSEVELVGVEAAGKGIDSGEHAASLQRGEPGVLARFAQLPPSGRKRSGPSGALDLCRARLSGVGPEHSYLKDSGRAEYVAVGDDDAVAGLQLLSRLEGIIPALETAHAVAWLDANKKRWSRKDAVLICISGRGDKDVAQLATLGLAGK